MKILLIFLLTILLTACGQSGKSTSSTKKTATFSEEDISAIMNQQNFECSPIDGVTCPEGVARLLILDKADAKSSSVCSGFLIGEDTLITNNHCIKNQAICEDTYVAVYNGLSYENNKCEKVLKTLNDYPNPNDPKKKLDVTIVKLKNRFYGKIFKFANNRPKAYDFLTVWVVDHTGLDLPTPNLVDARLTEFKCTFTPDSEVESMVLEKCPVIGGNSGSPVLNSSGEIVGIIWGGTLANFSSTQSLTVRRLLFKRAIATDFMYFKDYVPSL